MTEIMERNEIIPIRVNDDGTIKISGRDLHEFLEVKSKYIDWINRMLEYGFTENIDYMQINELSQKKEGSRNVTREIIDHVITIEMAKEISMLQRNEKLARRYFIEVEKAFNTPEKVMARALKIADESIKRLTTENKIKTQMIGELKPKADYTDKILKSKSLVTITAIAKDYGMSGSAFNKLLHDLKVQYKQGKQWLLYAQYQAKGYTHSETIDFERRDGTYDVNMITKWTQKGRLFLYDLLKENNILPIIEK